MSQGQFKTTEHVLKTWSVYWDAIASGRKNFEVRRDDRGFQRGDILVLRRFDPKTGLYDRVGYDYRDIRKRVAYILTGGQWGIEPGHVVMGLENAE